MTMTGSGRRNDVSTKVVGFAGWSGAGKTTLICKLIPILRARSLRVSTLKHAHHAFDIDKPGKDSYEHRQAGAEEVLIASSRRWALLHELSEETEPALGLLLLKLGPVDLVIIEGFKSAPIPKLEVHRIGNGKPLLFPGDHDIKAVAADRALPEAALPVHDLDDVAAIADRVLQLAMPLGTVLEQLSDARIAEARNALTRAAGRVKE
jgi:molybdopterin-guanine dinucleotide biosynthesis adapter protein